jgi:integrase
VDDLHNPVRDLDRDDRPGAHRQTEPRYLTAGELETLLAAMGDAMRPAAAACTYAALRVSDALGLRWEDIDFKAGTITIAGQLGRDGKPGCRCQRRKPQRRQFRCSPSCSAS